MVQDAPKHCWNDTPMQTVIEAPLRELQVPLVDLDTLEDAQQVFNSGLGGHRVFIAPENARSMKFRLEEAVALRPPPGYTPAEAVQGFCNVSHSHLHILNAQATAGRLSLVEKQWRGPCCLGISPA